MSIRCEGCLETSDGSFAVENLFSVEVCAECARALRRAIFYDDKIVAGAAAFHASRLVMDQLADSATIGRLLDQVTDDDYRKIYEACCVEFDKGRRRLFDSVMGWLDERRKQPE